MKTCKACATPLDPLCFPRSPNYKDGLSSTCRSCVTKRTKRWRADNREEVNATKRAWSAKNPGAPAAHGRKYREANKDKCRASTARWESMNPEKKEAGRKRWRVSNPEKYKAVVASAGKKWRRGNPGVVNAKTAKRRAALRHATPAWADLCAIRKIYIEAAGLSRETGISHEVDHIVPLQSPKVCGLHAEQNLQIIYATANRKKHNHLRQSRLIA